MASMMTLEEMLDKPEVADQELEALQAGEIDRSEAAIHVIEGALGKRAIDDNQKQHQGGSEPESGVDSQTPTDVAAEDALDDNESTTDKASEEEILQAEIARAKKSYVQDKEQVDALELYLQQIGKRKLLTATQEVELAKRIERGDLSAKEHMVEANLRLAVSIARKY